MSWREPGEADPAWHVRRTTFDRTADAYDRYRPGYPDELFEAMRAFARLAPGDRILEVGTGTGKATLPVARWGSPVLCLEPAKGMARVARRNLEGFPNVEVRTTSLEGWDVERSAFGLALCAQAYHWLDAAIRDERMACALRSGGAAALFWNRPAVPPGEGTFHERVQHVYRRHAPALAHDEIEATWPEERHALEGSAFFVELEQRLFPWSWTLDTEHYIGLLGTHSPHAALPPDVRGRLLDGIAHLADSEFAGRVTERYVAALDLARRR